MSQRHKRTFTLPRLIVIAIITLIFYVVVVEVAFPPLERSRSMVGERGILGAIDSAIETFAGDMGYYPESSPRAKLELAGCSDATVTPDQGAHRLFEALAGLDSLGYHRDHHYAFDANANMPLDASGNPTERWGPYIRLEAMEIGTLQDVPLRGDNFKSVNDNKLFLDHSYRKHPLPVLYYRANPKKTTLREIYSYQDNAAITAATTADGTKKLYPHFDTAEEFFEFIRDPRTGTGPEARPYIKDSFILIIAGDDRQYGTDDDITNFRY